MRWRFLVMWCGVLIGFVLFARDREIAAGVERLSATRVNSHQALDADPDLKLISERSPYMRTER